MLLYLKIIYFNGLVDYDQLKRPEISKYECRYEKELIRMVPKPESLLEKKDKVRMPVG